MDLLSGKRFEVASFDIAAGYTGWLLKRFGAEVDHRSRLDPEGIGAYLADGATFAAEPTLQAARGATLITDTPVNAPTRQRLGELSKTARVIWITPWGLDGSWSERPATDLTAYAAGGWMASVGEAEREPIAPPGGQGQYMAGLFASIAALGNEATKGETAASGLVDIAMVDVIASTVIYDPIAFQYHGVIRGRAGNRFSHNQATLVTLPCKDGHVGIHAALHRQWVSLANLVGHPELVEDPRFRTHLDRAQHLEELDGYLLPWLAGRTRLEAYHELQRHRIPSSYMPTIEEVLASPQLRARNAWETVTTPSGTKYEMPGPVARVKATSDRPANERNEAGPSPWREGKLRVVDLSMGWAGPLVTHILAALGADVLKVESHTHFDWWRGSRPPGSVADIPTHEISHVFNSANRGKRGITLNLTTPKGNELVRKLVASADLLVENYGAGVMEKLGLDPNKLMEENPGLVVVRQPGFGSDGPECGYLTFGNTIEGNSGLSSIVGYADGPPMMLSNALGDPVSGLTGAASALAGLAGKAATGRGVQVECAQIEGFLPLVSEALISYQATGELPARRGNVRPGHTPSGAFPCAGDDSWAVVEVRSDEEWGRLTEAIGEDWAKVGQYASAQGRERCRKELEARFREWTRGLSREEVVEVCVGAGVPAAPVCNEADMLAFEPLDERGFWEGQEREIVGFHMYSSLPIVENGERLPNGNPAPLLGQHTDEVLKGMGLDEVAIEELVREGVTGYEPAI